jgi:hypothetical protein
MWTAYQEAYGRALLLWLQLQLPECHGAEWPRKQHFSELAQPVAVLRPLRHRPGSWSNEEALALVPPDARATRSRL